MINSGSTATGGVQIPVGLSALIILGNTPVNIEVIAGVSSETQIGNSVLNIVQLS